MWIFTSQDTKINHLKAIHAIFEFSRYAHQAKIFISQDT